jgi:hypothetical protein
MAQKGIVNIDEYKNPDIEQKREVTCYFHNQK